MVDTRTEGSDGSPAHLLRYQYADHLGGTALELDAAGDVLTYEEYYPFGAASFASHRGAAAPPAKRYRYAGKERDEETGLSYHGARYYAPWLGRWTSADPGGVRPEELTGYVYCANRPTTLVDPDGASPQAAPHTSPPGTGPRFPPMGVPPGLEGRPPAPPSTPQPPQTGPAAPRTATPGTTPRTGPGPSGGTSGLRAVGRWLGPIGVFLSIMLASSNAGTNYQVQYTDEDTGQALTFRSLDELEGYKNQKRAAKRRQEEERQAPGPADKRGPAQAPGDPSKPGPAVEPDLRLPPAEAPGAERDESVREAPGAADPGEAAELGPLDRPLTDPEKADVLKTLKKGKPLSKAQKDLLRGEARWMWQQHTKGKGPQPGKKWQLHHLVALEFIHLFKGELYPNAPKNLYLMQTQPHQDLHWIIGKVLRDIVASGGKITREILEKISEGTLKHWPGRTMWTK
jgi:RHS repeat-associated protein